MYTKIKKYTGKIQNTTYTGNVCAAPTRTVSGAKSRTAIIDGVDIDFCRGNLAGSKRNCSASRFALSLLKSFLKNSTIIRIGIHRRYSKPKKLTD